jgi:hypothetical protein
MSSTSAYLTPPVRPPARASLARASARRPARATCAVLSSSGRRQNVRKLQLLLHVDQLAPPNALRVEADNLRRLTVCVAVQCLSLSTYRASQTRAHTHVCACTPTHAHRASRK